MALPRPPPLHTRAVSISVGDPDRNVAGFVMRQNEKGFRFVGEREAAPHMSQSRVSGRVRTWSRADTLQSGFDGLAKRFSALSVR